LPTAETLVTGHASVALFATLGAIFPDLFCVGDCLNMHKEEEEKSAPNFGSQLNNGAGCGEMQGGGKARKGYA